MINSDLKQTEWNAIADSEEDYGKQVLRPIGDQDWAELAEDISKKLRLNVPTYSLLDIGCGNAFLLTYFQSEIGSITGIDYAPAMIEAAQKNIPGGIFSVGNASSLNFSADYFDRTLCYSIFHYFRSDDMVFNALDEICRVTKPGGIALIGDLLDKDKEQQIKSNSDLLTEAKLSLIKRYSEWRFIDLPRVLEYLETKAKKVEVLEQPKNFKCSYYRKDLRIWF